MDDKCSATRHRIWLTAASIAGVLLGLAAWFYLTLPDVSFLRDGNPEMTALMRQRQREARSRGAKLAIRQEWVSMSRIPPLLRHAVRLTEDAGFYGHEGIDFEELKESIKRDWREKRLARGGSTITQQLAKNLFLSTSKNPLRKLREYFIAGRLERELGKERIFYLYLNVIELGPGLFGVEAGARHWFGKHARELTLRETVRLVSVIPRPLSSSPTDDSAWVRWRARWILGKLRNYGYISSEAYEEEIRSFRPLPGRGGGEKP